MVIFRGYTMIASCKRRGEFFREHWVDREKRAQAIIWHVVFYFSSFSGAILKMTKSDNVKRPGEKDDREPPRM
jgi:hypothetical protein